MHNTYATFTQLRSIINEWTGVSIVFFYTNFFLHLSTLSIIHTDNNSLMDALGQLGVQYLAQRCRLFLGSLTPPAQPWWDILSLHCLLSKLFFPNLLFFFSSFSTCTYSAFSPVVPFKGRFSHKKQVENISSLLLLWYLRGIWFVGLKGYWMLNQTLKASVKHQQFRISLNDYSLYSIRLGICICICTASYSLSRYTEMNNLCNLIIPRGTYVI